MTKYLKFFILLAIVSSCKENEVKKEEIKKQPNILFIAIDDLRPELGAYGSDIAISPNIDALAADGLLFNNAYCQEAICSPSRASVMTGARPETLRVIENYSYFRDLNPDIETLPQHLRANGYETVYTGKIFHPGYTDAALSWSRKADPNSISTKAPRTPGGFKLVENQELYKSNSAEMAKKYGKESLKSGLGRGPAYEFVDLPDNEYEDGYNTDLAIATLKDMVKEGDKPFFLGLGFLKPHLDWVAPKKYWDLYDDKDIKLAKETTGPKDGAEMGLHASFELRARANIPNAGEISDEQAIQLKHAYLACVSYVDAQIGRMIDALDEAGIRDNTIIVLWSDHGWHLGDMGIWGKATNYEIATRVPLIVWSPEMAKENRGRKTDALVELVDMYPTLCELTGVSIPETVEGQSFAPLLKNPDLEWKKAAFSQFPTPALREWAANPLSKGMRETYFGPLIEKVEERIIKQQGDTWDRDLFENRLMGYSMRTKDYRFIVWKDYTKKDAEPIFVELFNHQTDPSETINIAKENPELVASLLVQFNKGWQGNLSTSSN
ncbi:sulfatase [Cellulophaga sp. E16_2]|uniref:sulfatase n=1 Tax=Cellulophaga sp. E16_2 TaxID=2789297 RepID=UPI001A9254C1|nr:sulfatase [Cellulophaga sp. E16_2]MBO0590153.1 sulfatase [Cellulophaga sp. E16_2]